VRPVGAVCLPKRSGHWPLRGPGQGRPRSAGRAWTRGFTCWTN